jgi:hypothetical protein
MATGALDAVEAPAPVRAVLASPEQHLVCTDIVFHWRRKPRFVDTQGRPKKLNITGDPGSFQSLVLEVAPTFDPIVLLDYLESLGCVRCSDGLVELATESVLACAGTSERTVAAETVLAHMHGFLGSVEHNLVAKKDGDGGRFERACYAVVPANLVPVVQRLIADRGQNFIDAVDEWLVRHQADERAGERVCLVGSGAYVFVHDSNIFKSNTSRTSDTTNNIRIEDVT